MFVLRRMSDSGVVVSQLLCGLDLHQLCKVKYGQKSKLLLYHCVRERGKRGVFFTPDVQKLSDFTSTNRKNRISFFISKIRYVRR